MRYKTLLLLEKISKPLSIGILALFGVLILSSVFFVHGCAPVNGLSKEQSNLLQFRAFYNQQFEDYQRATANPELLTEKQKEVLRIKADLLKKMHPLIRAYEIETVTGEEKAAKTAILILELIDQFGGDS